jgi:hypothetical protein
MPALVAGFFMRDRIVNDRPVRIEEPTMTRNNGKIAIAVCLLMICAASAVAESVSVPSDTWLYPPPGSSDVEVSFAEAANSSIPQQLHFEGSIHNSSFLNGANVSFWFDWTDADGTTHTTDPEAFLLTPIMGTWTSHATEFFSRDLTIPYSPAEESIHFANQTSGSLDGSPVLVSGTLASVPEPSSLLLAIVGFAALSARRRKSVPHNRV